MRDLKSRVVTAIGTAMIAIGCCSPREAESLVVTMHPQETDVWCWAASGQMVMDYLGHDVHQCTQADNRFGRTDCCNQPVPDGCVQTGWPEFTKYNFTYVKTSDAPLTWETLKSEISTGNKCGNRPFCFTWKWTGPGGGGHVMVAVGYQTITLLTGPLDLVEIIDPLPVNQGTHKWISYSAYVSGAYYAHWDDYYRVTYIGGE